MDKLIKSLPKVIAAAGGTEEVAEAACVAAWKHVVGDALSSHAIPVQLLNKTLVVAVNDIVWQRQLEELRGQLLYRLNSVLGPAVVKLIEVRIEPARFKARLDSGVSKAKADNTPVPLELISAAAGIDDPGLRRAFLGAAVSCVNRLEKRSEI